MVSILEMGKFGMGLVNYALWYDVWDTLCRRLVGRARLLRGLGGFSMNMFGGDKLWES